jgi:hypothetical protein
MDWTIKWLDSNEYIRADLSGPFSVSDARSLSSEVTESSNWKESNVVLVDDTDLDVGDVSASDVESMSRMMAELDGTVGMSRVAIVAPSDLQFGLARQFQIQAQSRTTAVFQVFRREDAAIGWLTSGLSSIDPGDIPPLPLIKIT